MFRLLSFLFGFLLILYSNEVSVNEVKALTFLKNIFGVGEGGYSPLELTFIWSL